VTGVVSDASDAKLPVMMTVYDPALPAAGISPPDISPALMGQLRLIVGAPGRVPLYVQNVSPGSKPQPWMYRVCVSITEKGGGAKVHGPVLLSENAMLGVTVNVAVVVSAALVVRVTV
jgi:hypothetical protein